MVPLFDPRRPGFLDDPHGDLAALRAYEPVHWSGALKSWVLTGYDPCKLVLNDPRFSANRIAPFRDNLDTAERRRLVDLLAMLEDWFVFSDPPKHTRLRRLANQVFPPRVLEGMAPRIRELVALLVADLQKRGEGDLIRDFGFPLPVMVIADMLGVPLEDQNKFKRWSDDLATFVGSAQLAADKRELARESARAMCEYFREIIAARRREPGKDRLSRLISESARDEAASEAELVATCVLLLFAGHETTTNLIGNGLLSLMRHPDELDRLRAEPGLIESAVEELLRYEGPAFAMTRIATEDMTLGGQALRAGERVFAVLAAANRDPSWFDDPDRLDVGRTGNRHLTFGYGIHFCLGAPLARLEGRIAIGTLLARLGPPRLRVPAPEWVDSLSLRGVVSLPVSFAGQVSE